MAKRKKTNGKKPVLDVPVEFGGVSIGDGTARLGLRISRAVLNIDAADVALCGRRLLGRVVVMPPGDDPAQTYLLDGVEHTLDSTFDVHRIGVSPKHVTAGLTFSLQKIDVDELAHFAAKAGRLIVGAVEALPAKAKKGSDKPIKGENDD